MAKRTKRTTGKRGKGKGPKPTGADNPAEMLGPRRLTGKAAAEAAKRQQAEIEEEFQKRRRQQLAEAVVKLDPTDVRILELTQSHPGITQEQIGDLVGLRRQAVNERMNAPKFTRILERFAMTALETFEGNKARAARVLGELLGSPDDTIKLRAAIAHMWPEIHREDKGSGGDFVAFVQEAFALANAQKDQATGTDGKGE